MCQGVISQICNAFKSKRKFLKALLLLCLTLSLTSCLEVKQAININKDGSGDARLEVAVQQEWASQLVPKLKGDMPKGWSIVEEKEKEGKHVVIFNRKFKDISELNDNEARYTFSSERKGFLKKSFILEVSQLKSSDMPFPYEVSIKLPGSIDETDGIKISSNEVKWNLQGLRRGTKLSVKSSAFALPDFGSLKEAFNSLKASFNKVFDSVFYREAIVFLRDNNLWVMDSDGKNQRQLTKDGVGNWSVSRNGKIAFDKFDPFSKDKGLNDLNIYITSAKDNTIKKLTSDGRSRYPKISPSGINVAFQKFKWDGEAFRGTDEGIGIIDLVSEKHENLEGLEPIPNDYKHKRMDSNIIWSPDGKHLIFERDFAFLGEGDITYSVDLKDLRYSQVSYRYRLNLDLYNKKILCYDLSSSLLSIYDVETKKDYLLTKKLTKLGKFSIDGNKIVFTRQSDEHLDLWIINTDGKDEKKLTQNLEFSDIDDISWSADNRKIIFSGINIHKYPEKYESLLINSDGSNLKKLADNATSPEWTSIPKITFVSHGIAKIIILIVVVLAGVLFLFGMALITRKAVKAVIHKIPKKSVTPRSIFCPQCGKENSPSASFCTNCGQKLR